jgi:predicted nucleotidyltransferase
MGSVPARIAIDRERIAEFCRKNDIRRLSLFGSVLRDDFTPTSDVDLLIEVGPGTPKGFAFFGLEAKLEAICSTCSTPRGGPSPSPADAHATR